MTLRVAAYIRPRGFVNPTGVGKHQIHMVSCLAAAPGVELSLLASRPEFEDARDSVPTTLRGLPLTAVGLGRRALEGRWTWVGFPPAEWWCGQVDWVYCPFEAFVPTRKASLAATIHCVNWFEEDLPWYGDPAVRRTRRRLRPRFQRIVDKADLILTVSEFLKGRLCELFRAVPNRVVVVGNGAEEEFFAAGKEAPPLAESWTPSPYALVVAALESRKGAEYVLDFARALRRVEPEARVVIAGGSCGLSPFVQEAQAIPSVELRDYVGTQDLVGLMRNAVALLILSRYDTFGIPAVEAMACGTPVIAANFAGLPEVVGDSGILVDPSRAGEVVDVFCALLRDPTLRDSYRNAGLRRSENFTWDKCAGRALAAMRTGG